MIDTPLRDFHLSNSVQYAVLVAVLDAVLVSVREIVLKQFKVNSAEAVLVVVLKPCLN
jgi:hypothetical protein